MDYKEAKGLHEVVTSGLKDGDERNFCFLSIDVVGHSKLSSIFSPESINNTLMNLRNWINPIIKDKNGTELNWGGDGGNFYFLKDKTSDKAIDNAVISSKEILKGLAEFNDSHNQLYKEGKRTDIRLRLGLDFGSAIYRVDHGNLCSEYLNTACKIQKEAQPNSAMLTYDIHKSLSHDLINHLKEDFNLRETSLKFKDQPSYIFSLERIIDQAYEEYFNSIARLRQREFEHLSYWVDLYAVETRLTSMQEIDKGRTVRAIELINECVTLGKNALVYGESGSGKTFTCLKLFESIRDEYYAGLNKKIPLFVELSRSENNSIENVMKRKLENIFDKDKGKYIVFLDGLNEAGDLKAQERLLGKINEFAVLNPDTRLFVTTQTIDASYMKSERFELYEIQPFKREDVIEYLSKFKNKFEARDEAEKFYDSLSDLMKDFISKPVFLNILVSTYKKDQIIKTGNPGELMKEYEEFLCGPRDLSRQAMDEVHRKYLAPFLAFNMCRKNEKAITWVLFNDYIQGFNKETGSTINEVIAKDMLTNRFKLMKKDENDGLEFIHQTLRDYFAAVYMKNNRFSSDEIFRLVYADSTKNNDPVNALRLFAGIIKPEAVKEIIKKFIEKDLYLSCELFAWSSVSNYEEEFVDMMHKKIDIISREYLLNLNEVVLFYLKVLDLLKKAGMENHPSYALCHMNLGIAYRNKLDYDRAIEAFKKAIKIYESNSMQNHPSYALCHMNLGNAYDDIGRKDEAVKSLELALKIFAQNESIGNDHPYYQLCLKNLNKIRAADGS